MGPYSSSSSFSSVSALALSSSVPVSFIGSPQQWSVPPPGFVTITSFPQMSQKKISPMFSAPFMISDVDPYRPPNLWTDPSQTACLRPFFDIRYYAQASAPPAQSSQFQSKSASNSCSSCAMLRLFLMTALTSPAPESQLTAAQK